MPQKVTASAARFNQGFFAFAPQYRPFLRLAPNRHNTRVDIADLPKAAIELDTLAAQIRSLAARTGRNADEDAAFHIEQAAYLIRRADRRLTAAKDAAAAQAAAQGKRPKRALLGP